MYPSAAHGVKAYPFPIHPQANPSVLLCTLTPRFTIHEPSRNFGHAEWQLHLCCRIRPRRHRWLRWRDHHVEKPMKVDGHHWRSRFEGSRAHEEWQRGIWSMTSESIDADRSGCSGVSRADLPPRCCQSISCEWTRGSMAMHDVVMNLNDFYPELSLLMFCF